MDPLTLAAIMGGAGLLKSELVDVPKEKRDRQLAAATQRYSPWTGLRADPIKQADPVGSAMQFGVTGAAMGQGMQAQQSQTDLNNAMGNYYNSWGKLGKSAPAPGAPAYSLTGGLNYDRPSFAGVY